MTRRSIASLIALAAAGILFCGCGRQSAAPNASKNASGKSQNKTWRIAMCPKQVGIPYFNACRKGAEKAAKDLGVQLLYDGPDSCEASKQVQMIEAWILQGVDAICVAPNDPNAMVDIAKKAKEKNVLFVTWDTDAPKTERALMINQCDAEALGRHAMDTLAQMIGGKGEYGILMGSLTAQNLCTWRDWIKKQNKEKYPDIKLVAVKETGEEKKSAFDTCQRLLASSPNLNGILAIDSVSLPGACEAILQAGKKGKIKITGFSTPNDMRKYVKEGVCEKFILWNPETLGYLTIMLTVDLLNGKEPKDNEEVPGVGKITLDPKDPKVVIMGPPFDFTAENIDQFHF